MMVKDRETFTHESLSPCQIQMFSRGLGKFVNYALYVARPHDLELKNRTLLISMLPTESSNIALIPLTKTGSQRNREIHKIEKQKSKFF